MLVGVWALGCCTLGGEVGVQGSESRGGIAAVLALLLGLACQRRSKLRTRPDREQRKSLPRPAHSPPTAGGGYYIEFRAAQIGAYGHSYVVYGNGVAGKILPTCIRWQLCLMALGHVLPVLQTGGTQTCSSCL